MKDFGLVVIGAHFGVWLNEKIIKYENDNILLVEPVPYNYKILRNKFSENKYISICINAVFSENKKKDFYYVKEDSIPKLGKHWASGIGSFNKLHILNHRTKRFLVSESDIETIDIQCLSFISLVSKYSIKKIDRLMLDVEGTEYKILKSINLKSVIIKEIFFEKKHFDGHLKEGMKLEEIKNKFLNNNYLLEEVDDENMLAKLKNS